MIRKRSPFGGLLFALFLGLLGAIDTPRAAAQVCVGDCNLNHQVTIDELLVGAGLVLESAPTAGCPPMDRDGNGIVSIDELVAAEHNLLDDCSITLPTSTPTVTPTFTPTQTPTSTPTTQTPTPTPSPKLEFDIEINPVPAQPGESVQVLIQATNAGTADLFGVEVETTIPAQVSAFTLNFTAGAPATCVGDGNTSVCSPGERLVWTVGRLAAGNGVTLSMLPAVATGAGAPPDGTQISFVATARSNGNVLATEMRNVTVESQRLLDLAVDDDTDPVAPGQALTYRLSFGNGTGSTLAQGTTLRLRLPGGVDFVSASDGGTLSAGVVQWTLGTLSPGQTGSRELVVQVGSALDEGTLLSASAEISDAAAHPTFALADTRVRTAQPLQLSVELNPDPVHPNATVTGTLTVMNTGAVQLLGVQVEVFLPDENANFLTNQTSGASATCVGDGNTLVCSARERLVWTVGTLASHAMTILTMPVPIRNTTVPGRVITFNASASETSGFTAAARASVRVTSP
jgi:hypothetical protein